LHASDLGALAGVDIGSKIEKLGVLSRASSFEELIYHYERSVVMLDHSGQKESVKLGAIGPSSARPFELW
jgi:hypothetical protein